MTDSSEILIDMSRQIGGLVVKVDGLAQDVTESRQESKQGRQLLYERVEAVESSTADVIKRLVALEFAQATTAASIGEMKPTFDAIKVMRHRGAGALAVVGLVATLIGGAIALKWEAAANLFRSIFGGSS